MNGKRKRGKRTKYSCSARVMAVMLALTLALTSSGLTGLAAEVSEGITETSAEAAAAAQAEAEAAAQAEAEAAAQAEAEAAAQAAAEAAAQAEAEAAAAAAAQAEAEAAAQAEAEAAAQAEAEAAAQAEAEAAAQAEAEAAAQTEAEAAAQTEAEAAAEAADTEGQEPEASDEVPVHSEEFEMYLAAMQAICDQILALEDPAGAEELWDALMEIWDEIYSKRDDGTLTLSGEELEVLDSLTEEILLYLQEKLGFDPYAPETTAVTNVGRLYYMEVGDTVSITISANPTFSTDYTRYADVTVTRSGSSYTVDITAKQNGSFGFATNTGNFNTYYTVLIGSETRVYVYVASEGFSDAMYDLLGIDRGTVDNNHYFPAGEIILDDSYIKGKEAAATTPGAALITSDNDWAYLLIELSNMNTGNLTGDFSGNQGNKVGDYVDYAIKDLNDVWGSQHSALFRWDTEAGNPSYGLEDQSVIYHLDLRFNTARIRYVYGNNGITAGTGRDGDVAVDWETFIQGVSVAQTTSTFGIPAGYRFAGYYSDEGCTVPWNGEAALMEDETIYIKLEPYDLEKEVNVGDGTAVSVGDVVYYTIEYYNNQSVEATVTITDKLDKGLDFNAASDGGIYDSSTHTITWTFENTAAGQAGRVMFWATVNEAAVETEEGDYPGIKNTAGVRVGNESEVNTNTVINPVLEKTVDVGDGTEVKVGDTLTYDIKYQNAHSEAADVVITDVLDAGLDFVSAADGGTYDENSRTITWQIPDVEANSEGKVSFTAKVNGDAVVREVVDNTASVKIGDDPAVNTNKVENPVYDPTIPEKTSNIESGSEVKVGDTILYTISYRNGHSVPATVTITDTLEEGLDFAYALNGGQYDANTRTVTWTFEDLAPYSEGSVTLAVSVNEDALILDEVNNTAYVKIGTDEDVEVKAEPIPVEDPEDPTKAVNVGDGTEVYVGDELTYTITYRNGHSTAADVTIKDVLDEGLDFLSAAPEGTYEISTDGDGHTVIIWTLENVKAYSEGEVTFTASVNTAARRKDEVENIAAVQVGNDPAVETNPVKNPLDDPEEPVKEEVTVGSGAEVSVGDDLIYTITYKNNHSTAALITITDVLDPGLTFAYASDGGVYEEGSHTVTWEFEAAAYEEGFVTLAVKVNEKALEFDEAANTASVKVGNAEAMDTNPVVNPVEHPEDPEKSVNVGEGKEVNVGDELTYTITYKNGHSTAAAVTITDVLDIGLNFVSATDGGTYDEETRTITWLLDNVKAYGKGSVTFTAAVNEDAAVLGLVENTAGVQVGEDAAVDTNKVENPVNDPEDPVKGVDVGNGTEVKVGENLTYTITYKNGYNQAATVTITDRLDEGLKFVSASGVEAAEATEKDNCTYEYDEETNTVTWTIRDVKAHTPGSVWVTVQVNEKALETDLVTNTAVVQVGDDPAAAQETNDVENPVEDPESPMKSVDPESGTEVKVGDTLTYTIDYKNGHSEAADVMITDVLDYGLTFVSAEPEAAYETFIDGEGHSHTVLTWTIEKVKAYGEGSVTFTATVNEDALEKDEVENTASVQVGEDPAVDTNEVENPVYHPTIPEKGVNIGDGTNAGVGEEILYSISYRNGHSTAADVAITDKLDPGVDFVYATNDGSYDAVSHTVTWTFEKAEPYAEGTVYLLVQVNETALVLDEVTNTAFVQLDHEEAVETNPITNPVPGKSVNIGDGTGVSVGDEITYTISYQNGHNTAADVVIIDPLDPGVDFVSAADGGIYDAAAHTVTWTFAAVEANTGGSVDLVVKVNETALVLDEVTNTASVQVENDAAVETNPITNPVPGKSVDIGDGTGVSVGDEITYTISYQNGHKTAADVVITDPLDPGVDFVSATDGGIYDASAHTVTWTFAAVEANTGGSVDLVVQVNETALVLDEVTNTASVQVENDAAVETNPITNPVPEKKVDVGDGTEVKTGDTLVYTISYENGHKESADIVITDTLDKGVDFVSATAGGSYDEATHSVTWTITDAEAGEKGTVELTVLVNEKAQVVVENTASVQVGNDAAVNTNPIENPVPPKSVDVDGDELFLDDGKDAALGSTLTYRIDYYNSSDLPANIIITDVLDIGLDYLFSAGGSYDESTRTITWTLNHVSAGERGSVTFTASVNESALIKGAVENTAQIQIGDNPAVESNPVENPVPKKSVDAGSGSNVGVGETLTYTIYYKNGHREAADVTITDVLDAGLDYIPGSADPEALYDNDKTLTWVIPDVAPYEEGSVTFQVTVNEKALERNLVENTASVQIGNDAAVDTNTIPNPVPEKTVDVGDETRVKVGDVLTYTITFANGHDRETQVTITDVLDQGFDETSIMYGDVTVEDSVLAEEEDYTVSYDPETRIICWVIAGVPALASGEVSFSVRVSTEALQKSEVDNTAFVQVGEDPDVSTETITNPVMQFFPIDEEIVTNPEDPLNEENWVKTESVNEYDAIEIEMSTMLPNIPEDLLTEGDYTMQFHGVLESHVILDHSEEDFTVYISGKEIPAVSADGTRYYRIVTNPEDECTFELEVNLTALYHDGIISGEDLGESLIQITFFADLEDDDTNGSYISTVWYQVYDGEDLLFTSEADVVSVYVLDITILKYDALALVGEDYAHAALAGAVFGIYYDPECENAVSRNKEPYTFTSGEDGRVFFTGLAEGTYYVKELEAPEGYVLSDEVLEVDLDQRLEDHMYYGKFANTPEPDTLRKPVKEVNVGNGTEVSVDDILTYTISYYNHNNAPAEVEITDVLDEGLRYISSAPEGEYNSDTHTVTWRITDVPEFTEGSVKLVVEVTKEAETAGKVENTAGVKIGTAAETDTNTVENPVHSDEPETEGPESETEEKESTPQPETEPGKVPAAGNGSGGGSTGGSSAGASSGGSSPKTGDETPVALMLMLALLAIGALAGGGVYRRRRSGAKR